MPKFLLVPNPIGRYSIGDRTPVLQVAADGSVTIYLQKDSPGPDRSPTGCPHPRATSARPCACTSPVPRSSKAITYCLPSQRSAKRDAPGPPLYS